MSQHVMTRRQLFHAAGRTALAGACASVLPHSLSCVARGGRPGAAGRPPNIVIVFTDDQGYQDLGCFGSPDIKTPNVDRLAREGMKFTDSYVTQPVCSASRAGLLTGCYSNRVSILGALGPGSKHGIHSDEMTLGEVCKQRGYATAIYGKWHLGHHPQFLPVRHGFDEYFGLPYSNDMWPHHPTAGNRFPPLPLIEGEKVVNANVSAADQTHLTTWYSERACTFIEKHKDRPFFVYVAHAMPHVPLFVSDERAGRSKRGLYGDVIQEVDWGVGRILDTLKRNGLDDNTLLIFTSDNGPWLSYGDHSGCALPLREGKGTTWDGGVREPCLMRWPGRIPAGKVCNEPIMTIDFLPTIAGLVGARLPEHKIDGLDIRPLMSGRLGAASPHEALFFYWGKHLQCVRMGKWKLHYPHAYRTMAGKPGGTGGKPNRYSQAKTDKALYDLRADIGEKTDVLAKHPDVVAKIDALADAMRQDLGDSATKTKGTGVREPGRLKV